MTKWLTFQRDDLCAVHENQAEQRFFLEPGARNGFRKFRTTGYNQGESGTVEP